MLKNISWFLNPLFTWQQLSFGTRTGQLWARTVPWAISHTPYLVLAPFCTSLAPHFSVYREPSVTHGCREESGTSKRKTTCPILRLENVAKRVDKFGYWHPDRLLSQRTGNGKKVYRLNKLFFKAKSGFNRLAAPYPEAKIAPLGKSSTNTHTEISTPKSVKPFGFTWGKAVTAPPTPPPPSPDSNNHGVSKARNPGLSHRSQFPNSLLAR